MSVLPGGTSRFDDDVVIILDPTGHKSNPVNNQPKQRMRSLITLLILVSYIDLSGEVVVVDLVSDTDGEPQQNGSDSPVPEVSRN